MLAKFSPSFFRTVSVGLALLVSVAVLLRGAEGHGYLHTPRSVNFVAYQDGIDPGVPGGTSSTPLKQWCSHCLNRGGICGALDPSNGGLNYNYPPSVLGNVLPFQGQMTYTQGDLITIEYVITAHHWGHVELKACPIANEGDVPSQACFDMFPLLFVQDDLYNMLPDNRYRGRAYLSGPSGVVGRDPAGMRFVHKFRLPPRLNGGMILLQWHYVTANTCFDVGYDTYNFPFTRPNLSFCHQPLPSDGSVGGAFRPEQFWNCAQINIEASVDTDPTPIPSPNSGWDSSDADLDNAYCGVDRWDAASSCTERCRSTGTDADCPSGQFCFRGIAECTSDGDDGGNDFVTASPQAAPPSDGDDDDGSSGTNYCGATWADADASCSTTCTTNADCPSGQFCFADVTSCVWDVPRNTYFCGTSFADAEARCVAECPSGLDVECAYYGHLCFADVTACAASSPQPNTNYCGTSWQDADSRCSVPCPGGVDSECPSGEYCFADAVSCTGNQNYCGTTWQDADTRCAVRCPGGVDSECPPGESCFADATSCGDGGGGNVNTNYCGTSWQDADTRCAVACPGGVDSECPLPGESCFADATSCGDDGGGNVNTNFCGTSWQDADTRCSVRCPGGMDSECPSGQSCFAAVTSCNGNGPVPSPTVPMPSPPTPVPPVSPTPNVDPSPVPPVPSPPTGSDCSADPALHMSVNVGYYQSWAIWRNGCHVVNPEDIDVDGMGYTHLVYSFASISADYRLQAWNGADAEEFPMYARFNALKFNHPNLKTFIAVGGWTHNDPGQFCSRFSDTSSTAAERATFAASVVDFMRTHNFDGIDFDWEYPADPGRCGVPADRTNYALLVQAVRDAIEAAPDDYLITMAVPASTTSLDRGYDLPSLANSLDWFNLMTYDIYGYWSSEVGSHTDMRHIRSVIPHFINNGVPSTSLVLGLGSYGRTFTLSNPDCDDIGCPFNGARGGGCPVWDENGYIAYVTIQEIIESGQYKKLEFNAVTESMELVTTQNEFISFDNPMTFTIKATYASGTCMRGYMWWAVDMIKDSFRLEILPPTISPAPTTGHPTMSPTVSAAPTTALPTKAPVLAPECPNGYSGLMPYRSCTQYFHCENGSVVGIPYSCAAGTLFDESLQNCNWESQVTCSLPSPPPPPTTSSPSLSPTLSPTLQPQTTSPISVSLAPTLSPTTKAPTSLPTLSPSLNPVSLPATSAPQPSGDPTCPPGHTGYLPHNQCKEYFYCQAGAVVGVPLACAAGTLWDTTIVNCNWANLVTCDDVTPSPPTSSPPTLAPQPSDEPQCPMGHTGWLAHNQCREFFYCQAGVVVGVPQTCAPGTLYDETIQNCNWEDHVTCYIGGNPSPPSLAPIGGPTPSDGPACPTGHTGWLAYDDCKGYFYCQGGTLVGVVYTCATGTLYDMTIQNCNWADQVVCFDVLGSGSS